MRVSGPVVLLLALLVCDASGVGLTDQIITIKLVNGKNGHAMSGRCVNVWVGNQRKDAMAIPVDKEGVASLTLTHNDAEVNTEKRSSSCGMFGVVAPVVKYADTIRVNVGYVLCETPKSDYSWLAIKSFPTEQVMQHGVVTRNTCGPATASAKPGELILFVRPLTLWEVFKQ